MWVTVWFNTRRDFFQTSTLELNIKLKTKTVLEHVLKKFWGPVLDTCSCHNMVVSWSQRWSQAASLCSFFLYIDIKAESNIRLLVRILGDAGLFDDVSLFDVKGLESADWTVGWSRAEVIQLKYRMECHDIYSPRWWIQVGVFKAEWNEKKQHLNTLRRENSSKSEVK